jgi:hypothetical protein
LPQSVLSASVSRILNPEPYFVLQEPLSENPCFQHTRSPRQLDYLPVSLSDLWT